MRDGSMDADPSIQYVKGVGPQRARLFEKKGIANLVSLIHFFPIRYEDRRQITGIGSVRYGRKEVVVGEVYKVTIKRVRGKSIFEVIIRDDTGYLSLVWFHFEYAYMVKRFRTGSRILAYGDVGAFGSVPQMIHPDIEEFDRTGDDTLNFGRIVPVYPAIEGISQRTMRRIMKSALDAHIGSMIEYLPGAVRKLCSLHGYTDSIYNLHFPGDEVPVEALNRQSTEFHRRIKFDEFFFFEMALAIKKRRSRQRDGIVFSASASGLIDDFEKGLPFQLTDDQRNVIEEIVGDLSSGYPMNRLLQGDVGSGF
ncbi:MAG: OB-fold nucleic acid binding domain-containing protein, partial [Deltaproteobacteria bacterium]|nr:OB-fold nucleic acid binding domain-containing protein [Deltaproteobacteria bacterium]